MSLTASRGSAASHCPPSVGTAESGVGDVHPHVSDTSDRLELSIAA
jgi:hypothetical protein